MTMGEWHGNNRCDGMTGPLDSRWGENLGSVDYNRILRRSCRNGNLEPILTPTPVILAAAGIQSPFPIQPGACLQECSRWDVNLSIRRVLVGTTVLAHNQGSGFPLRRQ